MVVCVPARILIIEDEPAIADTLLYALATEGFSPHWCATGQAGLAALQAQAFDFVVLDIGLPDGSGFEFCKQIRARSTVPILFLTARNSEIDRVVGLEIGGDDYLAKPFSPRELTARVKVILRRVSPALDSAHHAAPPSQSAHPLQSSLVWQMPSSTAPHPWFAIDEARCVIRFRGLPLELTRIEFRLCKTLVSQPGRVFTREQLLGAAWDEPEASLDRTVDAHIKTLRAKLHAVDPAADPIKTHRGLGYSLRELP
jgi:two-component system catabolic regulation response regulator CreB